MKFNQPQKRLLIFTLLIILFLCILMVLFFGPTDNWIWDPSFYYAQLKSPIIDRDLDFFNDTVTGDIETKPTVTGMQPTSWPMGTAILWSPFFMVAHWIVSIISPANADGFSDPYIAFASIATIFYAILAILVIYKIINRYTDQFTSILVCILCLAATPLFFYIFRQPISAHVTTLLFSSLIILLFLILDEETLDINFSGVIFGVLFGMAAINRWTAILLGLFPLIYYFNALLKSYKIGGLRTIRPVFFQILIFTATFFITISPQIILWYHLYNRILIIPQSASTWITNVNEINLIKIFFADNRGLLTWAPFMMIGLVGIFWIKNPRLRWGSIIYATLLIIVLSFREDWYGGGWYGTRFFLELLPIIAVGFVSLLSWIRLKPRLKSWLLIIFTALAVLHQFTLMHTIEFGSDLGWGFLQRYQSGKSLGLGFQWKSIQKIFYNPGSLFFPRPYVGQNRQAILVNLLSGVRGIKNYSIQVISLALIPFVSLLAIFIHHKGKKQHFLLGSIVLLCFAVFWSIYLMLI